MTPTDAPETRFPPDLLTRLRASPWFRGDAQHGARSVNVLGIGLGDAVPALFSNCRLLSRRRGDNLQRSMWECGETSVQDLSDLDAWSAIIGQPLGFCAKARIFVPGSTASLSSATLLARRTELEHATLGNDRKR